MRRAVTRSSSDTVKHHFLGAIMSVWKYSVAPLPEPRVHGRAAPALKHLTVAHQNAGGHLRESSCADDSAGRAGHGWPGRLKEAEVDLLRSALVLAGAGLDAVLKRLARDARARIARRRIAPCCGRQGVQGTRFDASQGQGAVDLVDQGDTRRGPSSGDDPPVRCLRVSAPRSTRCFRRD